jgi:hypothetical protein
MFVQKNCQFLQNLGPKMYHFEEYQRRKMVTGGNYPKTSPRDFYSPYGRGRGGGGGYQNWGSPGLNRFLKFFFYPN